MSRLISRDPYARTELHRERQYFFSSGHSCDNCGSSALFISNQKGYFLYRYYQEEDRIHSRKDYIKGHFCSIACMRSYHG